MKSLKSFRLMICSVWNMKTLHWKLSNSNSLLLLAAERPVGIYTRRLPAGNGTGAGIASPNTAHCYIDEQVKF
jgi:hypothetical protein